MPYKDLERKREWERLHRPQRLVRRRQLRSIAAGERVSRPKAPRVKQRGAAFLLPLVAGGALAAYNPRIGMGTGA